MATDASADFKLTITDVFTIAHLGTVVFGPLESGVLHNREQVEIWDGDGA